MAKPVKADDRKLQSDKSKSKSKAESPSSSARQVEESSSNYLLRLVVAIVLLATLWYTKSSNSIVYKGSASPGHPDAGDYTIHPSTAPPSTSILEPTDLPVTASVDTVQIISKDGGDKAATAVAQNGQPSDSTESGSSVDTTSDPTITHNDNGVVDDVAVPRPHFMDVLESSDIFKNMSNSWREDTAQQILAIANLVELEHRVATAVPPSAAELGIMHDVTMASLSVPLMNGDNWFHEPASAKYFNPSIRDMPVDGFQAFVTRIHKEEGRMVVWGDIHGSFNGLVTTLRRLTQGENACLDANTLRLQHECRFLVLGDFVDRGENSVEVIFVLMLLRAINGDRMMFIRGNHEDMNMCMRYGLAHEVSAKYQQERELVLGRLLRLFQLFPVGAYIGTPPTAGERHYLQFSHGVFEFGYIPNNLLSSSSSAPFHYEHIRVVNRTATMERLRDLVPEMHARIAKKVRTDARMVEEFIGHFTPSGPSRPHTLGLCWTDLLVKPVNKPMDDFLYVPGRGTAFGLPLLENLLNLSSTPSVSRLHGILRGHQHNNAAGPMLDRLISSRGLVDAYGDGKGPSSSCPEVGGPHRDNSNNEYFVCTTISASESNLDFDYNSYVLVRTYSDWSRWVIEHHWKPTTSPHSAWQLCAHGPGVISTDGTAPAG